MNNRNAIQGYKLALSVALLVASGSTQCSFWRSAATKLIRNGRKFIPKSTVNVARPFRNYNTTRPNSSSLPILAGAMLTGWAAKPSYTEETCLEYPELVAYQPEGPSLKKEKSEDISWCNWLVSFVYDNSFSVMYGNEDPTEILKREIINGSLTPTKLKAILSAHPNLEAKLVSGYTPLHNYFYCDSSHHSAGESNREMAEMLINAGADVFAYDNYYFTPSYTCRSQIGRKVIVKEQVRILVDLESQVNPHTAEELIELRNHFIKVWEQACLNKTEQGFNNLISSLHSGLKEKVESLQS